jgi:hypothetical protein
MADYTIKNLKDLDDSAVAGGLSPQLEARFAKGPLGCEQSGLSYQRLAPDFRGFGHSHKTQEEIYVIVSGGGRMKLGDEVVDLKQWDAIRVSPATPRAFEAGPDGIELIAFGAGESGDSNQLQDFWTD